MMKPNQDTNHKHSLEPKVGDYWHEMFSPVCVVVDASPFAVTVCEKTRPVDEDHWTWDISELKTYTRDEFTTRWRYGRMGNEDTYVLGEDLDDIKNKCWCDVAPESHKWVREAILEEKDG